MNQLQSPSSTHLPAAVTELRGRMQGQVVLPGEPAYDELRLGWNRAVNQHPAVIAAAGSAEDVQAAVVFARQVGLGVAVMGAGHGHVHPADDCLLIVTGGMAAVRVDPAAQTVYVEAGAKWGPVLAAAQEYGLAPLLGSSPTVGAVGYTLGGGLGWLARKYGLAADSVVEFEVVTMDGRMRRASAHENSELFWGLKGGGGSLGIVTGMTVRLYPVAQVYAGNLFYPAEAAPEIFRRYRDWIGDLPEEMTTSVLAINFPPMPMLPEFLRGRSFTIVRGCYCGDPAEGEARLRYWRDWRAPAIDDFKLISFRDAAVISSDPVDPLPAFNNGAWLRGLSDSSLDALVRFGFGQGGPSPLLFAEVRHIGGAIGRVDRGSAAYGNRDAELLLSVVSIAPTPEVYAQLSAYMQQFLAALEPDLSAGVYLNFLEGPESAARFGDALAPGGYARLARLKAQYDPDNLLRYGHRVEPAE